MKFKSTQINMPYLKINQINNLSNLSFSSTQRIGVYSSVKKNQGFGSHNADRCVFVNPGYIVNDSDIDDSTAIK
ncbi:hypothetical protein [Guptibacillus spartinae]|uniref:hypothetical protein n=1 Tax=Guptibacillus spartinae TaxID=3025679 RepID=UPI00236259EE|nr:hypothetical protein [Pseudalkalibacillus spartinae]